MDDEPKVIDSAVVSVYEAQFVNGTLLVNLANSCLVVCLAPPMQLKAYQELIQDEMTKRFANPFSAKSVGDAQLVNIGMNLENEQCVRLTALYEK